MNVFHILILEKAVIESHKIFQVLCRCSVHVPACKISNRVNHMSCSPVFSAAVRQGSRVKERRPGCSMDSFLQDQALLEPSRM